MTKLLVFIIVAIALIVVLQHAAFLFIWGLHVFLNFWALVIIIFVFAYLAYRYLRGEL